MEVIYPYGPEFFLINMSPVFDIYNTMLMMKFTGSYYPIAGQKKTDKPGEEEIRNPIYGYRGETLHIMFPFVCEPWHIIPALVL